MRLSLKAMAIAAGLLWGGAILCVGLINLVDANYGTNFIQLTSSVYPWFHASRTIGNVVIGTVDGFIDGAFAGMISSRGGGVIWFMLSHPPACEGHRRHGGVKRRETSRQARGGWRGRAD